MSVLQTLSNFPINEFLIKRQPFLRAEVSCIGDVRSDADCVTLFQLFSEDVGGQGN